MNSHLNSLQLALRLCLDASDVSAEQMTDVIRETIKQKMDDATETTKKSRTILEKLRMPHHYSTCPDWMMNDRLPGGDESISFTGNGAFGSDGFFVQAAQPVKMNYDGPVGSMGEDSIVLG